ncbi:MAG: carbohydrate ABC transporter substrate-binding protein [Lachnospiraceae bacterium]|nr:carbohydrate ABC transporter substrate-binding protein [Lachnospiraceae bacterium]
MKKKLLSVMLVGAMVASLAACGGSSGSGTAAPAGGDSTAAAVTSGGEHKLTVSAWDHNFNIPALLAAAEDYKANVDPEFELEINEVSGSSDVETAITTGGSAGDFSQLTDIVLFQDHYIQKYVADYPDAWVPVEGADIDWSDFGEEKLSYSIIDGQHYGVPVDNGTAIFAYRVDILEEAGYTLDDVTDCTWADWIKIGEDVYNKTGKYLLSMDGDGNDLPYMMLQAEGASQWKDGEPYITENETMVKIIDVIVEAIQKNALYLANNWSDYTDQTIQGDMVAGVMNGNWIIPTIEQVEENSGKWEITNIPTLNGGGGYAANGGSSLYITSNCANVDLAKDFLAKTFGGSTATYDKALTDGGVITCCISAGQSEIYQAGVDYFNGQPIYTDIVGMGANVPIVEQNDYHYDCRRLVGAAIINISQGGASTADALKDAEEQLRFQMGL